MTNGIDEALAALAEVQANAARRDIRYAVGRALRDAAEFWGENPDHHAFESPRDTRNWLRDVASQYAAGGPIDYWV